MEFITKGDELVKASRNHTRIRILTLIWVVFALFATSISSAVDGRSSVRENFPRSQSGTYEDFIDTVWIFESSIDPAKQNYYNENWSNPVAGTYPMVWDPGEVIRDYDTGVPLQTSNLTS